MSQPSPLKPTAKQTILPDSNIRNLLPQDDSVQRSYEDLLYNERLDATLNQARYLGHNSPNDVQQHYTTLNRLPTLYEILNRRTESPVDLWSFYVFMRDYQGAIDYLDFWIDCITHLRLCKDYVKGLRESLILSEKHRSLSDNEKRNTTTSCENGQDHQVQAESPDYRESVSSSLLLEALLNEGFLDDKDSKRVSSFLQGNEYINVKDARINAIFTESEAPQPQTPEQEIYPQQQHQSNPTLNDLDNLSRPYEPIDAPRKVFAGDQPRKQTDQNLLYEKHDINDPINRNSTRVLPEQLEKYISNVKNGNISRMTLKSSSRNILNTYFKDNSPKRLVIPDRIIRKIRHDVEVQGRDDPDVFEDAKNYVYSAMERESLPFFLQQNALHNLSNSSSLVRLILGIFFVFGALWISYSLIFTNVQPKAIRAVLIVPFFIGFYLLFSFLYNLDPIMVFCRYSDNRELASFDKTSVKSKKKRKWIRNLYEPFVFDLLKRRSLWVLFLILLTTAIFSILFGLVPGHRI